jgi:hypothetical protein
MTRLVHGAGCEEADQCILDPDCEFYSVHILLEDGEPDEAIS